MIKGSIKDGYGFEELNYDNILKKITNWDIFRFYIPEKLVLGQAFCSKLRRDRHPSAVIKVGKKSNEVYYWDLSTGFHCNAVQYVMALFNLNYNEALLRVNYDFGLKLGPGDQNEQVSYKAITANYEQPDLTTSYKRLDVFTRKFTYEESQYWALRSITDDECKKENIFAIDKMFLDGSRFTNPDNLLRFAYYFPEIDSWKIYMPYADKEKKQQKWISNCPLSYIEGLYNLKKDRKCIGTKSRKDRIHLSKFIPETFNSQNENEHSITKENLDYIKSSSSECYLFWDNDETGVRACSYYNQFGLKYVNIPKLTGLKDPDDIVVNQGLVGLETFLKQKQLIK